MSRQSTLAIEATKLALADLDRFVSDPASMTTSPAALLDPAYLAARAALVDRKRAGLPAMGCRGRAEPSISPLRIRAA